MVVICSYNIRGLNKKPKQADTKSFLVDNKISFVSLVETRVKCSKTNSISKSICKHWCWEFNYDYHSNSRIWVGWDPSIWHTSILFKSDQVIHCKLKLLNMQEEFFVSIVYDFSTVVQRRPLWSHLVGLAPTANSAKWCLRGILMS